MTEQPSGVLLIDKAAGMTSHDVVAIARRSLGIKKIGHCGTLDPMATGLLMLVVNKATKLQDLLMAEHKEYEGTIRLGAETSSYDAEGDIVAEYSTSDVTEDAVREAFEHFKGAFDQIPPMVSAIKKGGVPLYKLARKGQEIEREPRAVTVEGYQIRFDIGRYLKCGGYLTALRRTQSGLFRVEGAVDVPTLKTAPREQLFASLISIEKIASMRGVR
jgi:tRNA pseudouridine55 synthase